MSSANSLNPQYPNATAWSDILHQASTKKNGSNVFTIINDQGKEITAGLKDLSIVKIKEISQAAIKELEANALESIKNGSYSVTENDFKNLITQITADTKSLINNVVKAKDKKTYRYLRAILKIVDFCGILFGVRKRYEQFESDVGALINSVEKQRLITLHNLELQKDFKELELPQDSLPKINSLVEETVIEKGNLTSEEKSDSLKIGRYLAKKVQEINKSKNKNAETATQNLQKNFDDEDVKYKAHERDQFDEDIVRNHVFLRTDSKLKIEDMYPLPGRLSDFEDIIENADLLDKNKVKLNNKYQENQKEEAFAAIKELTGEETHWNCPIRTAVSQYTYNSLISPIANCLNDVVNKTSGSLKLELSREPVKITIERDNENCIKSINVTGKVSYHLNNAIDRKIIKSNVLTGSISYNIVMDEKNRAMIKDTKVSYKTS